VLAVLVGILLLQGSLCDGPMAAAPCGAPCADTVVIATNLDAGGESPIRVDMTGVDVPGDHSGLMTLCLTVLMAVLFVLAGLRRPGTTVAPPLSTSVSQVSSVLSRVMRREQLCVQRL
jgi:hypothetical protein